MNKQKVWFVTGASQGIGLSMVKELLSSGYAVAATSRNIDLLQQEVGAHDSFLPVSMDVKNEESVQAAITATVTRFGSIDVVVNNAGYGLLGALEELSDAEARTNFDVNVFGLLHVVRNAMPYLRAQKSGHIFNIASIAGFCGAFPGWGIYCATKFAVIGLSESLAAETKDFNVKVTAVLPGYFRTNFLNGGVIGKPSNQIAEYASVRASEKQHDEDIAGNQPGDPVKAAKAMIAVAEAKAAPIHLFLGQDAYNLAGVQISNIQQDLESVRALATSTDFDK